MPGSQDSGWWNVWVFKDLDSPIPYDIAGCSPHSLRLGWLCSCGLLLQKFQVSVQQPQLSGAPLSFRIILSTVLSQGHLAWLQDLPLRSGRKPLWPRFQCQFSTLFFPLLRRNTRYPQCQGRDVYLVRGFILRSAGSKAGIMVERLEEECCSPHGNCSRTWGWQQTGEVNDQR